MGLKDSLLARTGGGTFTPPVASPITGQFKRGVQRTREWDRVHGLPRTVRDLSNVPDLTPVFKTPMGARHLWPIQSAALLEAERANGLFAPIGVGHGKFLITALLPEVLESARTVLFVPAHLRQQTLHLRREWAAHFRMREATVVSYHDLSSAKQADMLEKLQPDLIIADECHAFRHRSAARTKRFLRYFNRHPGTRFCGLSGTITTKSLRDYAHLVELALRKNSPLPNSWSELVEWAEAIDVSPDPRPPGILLDLCQCPLCQRKPAYGHNEADGNLYCKPCKPDLKQLDATGAARVGYRKRLVESPGVMATTEGALGTSLVLSARKPKIPASVAAALKTLERTWEIGGEELEDALAYARVERQLMAGFYYRWTWPGGQRDDEWLEARRDWHREVRDMLSHHAREGRDSPLLLAQAAARGVWYSKTWARWAKVKDRQPPPVEAVWLDDFLIQDAVKWSHHVGEGIIWYEHDAVGKRFAEMGLAVFGAGDDKHLLVAAPARTPIIVCSRRAHGTGKNLQAWANNLFTTPMSNGADWEQALGRTHRPGQEADEVTAEIYQHSDALVASLTAARRDARYIEDSTGVRQKLNYATYTWTD